MSRRILSRIRYSVSADNNARFSAVAPMDSPMNCEVDWQICMRIGHKLLSRSSSIMLETAILVGYLT